VPNISASVTDPAALAEAEVRLSASVVTYAHHASVGRVHWSRVSSSILYEVKPPVPADVLGAMADAKDVAATLAGYEPQAPNYIALKAKLADLRAGKTTPGKAPIPNGPAPKLGGQDDRVPQLRERFGLSGDGTIYDKTLADAVKKFQQEHELKVSGLLTQQTIDALNGRSPDRPIDTVLANLERWRWMPHDLGKDYVIVNLPDYTLRVFHDGHQVWMTRIVTGKPTMATPIMTAEMKYITVNPTWNVPPSIVAREYMPALAADPTVLARMGLRVSYNPDGSIHISQPPGDHNALGRVRFNFPNKFLVYQHDTPDKNLFALDKRAFSHGCMRVQDPVKYAEVLLNIVRPGEGYTEDRIHKMIASRGEQDIQFPHYLPVHLTYQTAFVDENGRLEFREDMYGRDQVLIAILRGEERKIAESPVDRREGYSSRPAAMAGGYYQNGYQGYQNGGNFFSRLFGGGFGDPQPAQRRRAAQGRQSWGFQ
jgi:murein L,D-transpeptidase YcbB/YkuD